MKKLLAFGLGAFLMVLAMVGTASAIPKGAYFYTPEVPESLKK